MRNDRVRAAERQSGQYLGTEIDGHWWNTYRRHGFFLRGNGHFWLDENAFVFRRRLTSEPMRIPFHAITSIRIGAWHAGKWLADRPIVKIDSTGPNGEHLSSGVGMRRREDAEALVSLLVSITGQSNGAVPIQAPEP
jgi:hypothetical protein